MQMKSDRAAIEIGVDEAIVLFELLADLDTNQQALELNSPAERLALVRLHGALEQNLVESFSPDYSELLKSARSRLSEQAG
jgi:hypothetical protein